MIKGAIAKLGLISLFAGFSPTVQAQESPPYIPQTAAALALQGEVQEYLNAVNLAQLNYFLEYSQFATSLAELNLVGFQETENYRYLMLPAKNPLQGMIMIAQAKDPRLKSYAGAAFVVASGESLQGIGGICETNLPSTSPPVIPTAPTFASTGILCPFGSHALTDFDRDTIL